MSTSDHLKRRSNRPFQFNWKLTLFSLLSAVLFVNLGFWQLHRVTEKEILILDQAKLLSSEPVRVDVITDGQITNGLPVSLVGSWDQDVILLLDNRVLDGNVGFEVLQLFHDNSSDVEFLVNRGFVKMGRTRQDRVEIPGVTGDPVRLSGKLHQLEAQYALSETRAGFDKFPSIVQMISIDQLSQSLHRSIFPAVIRLDETEIGALPRYWPVTTMTPERHMGYAIQWFTMAFAVVLAWLFFSFRRVELEEKR